jgi:uncharacterized protein
VTASALPGLQARFHSSLDAIPAADWDALRPDDNPFLSHAFLAGLERNGCLQPRAGWRPHHLTLYDDARLVAAAPCYLKSNSHGEFVFDHAWAEAYWRHGLDYFPKLLCAVPYSPVPGPRLLCGPARAPGLRSACLQALRDEVGRAGLSSAHINFDDDAPGHLEPGWLPRFDWQFHWHNRGWPDFDAFLGALSAKKRKNIRQERAQVQRAGIRFRCLHGNEASDADLDAMHGFYIASFIDKGNLPVLTLDFFRHLAHTMPRQLVLVLAERGGRAIAGALLLRSSTTLYGRYWGCIDPLPGLHFETCYYQGIDYCLRYNLSRFEPGAQGEHKLARGFLPTRTHSLHHLRDPRFSDAVAASLKQETAWLESYREELLAHSPYRND